MEPADEKAIEAWGRRIDTLLDGQTAISEWPDKLESSPSDLAALLLEFQQLEFCVSLCGGICSGQQLPGRDALLRHEQIARILTAFCDQKTKIDPSSLLALIQVRKDFGELREDPPLGTDVSAEQWERWDATARQSHVTMERIELWAESKRQDSENVNISTKPARKAKDRSDAVAAAYAALSRLGPNYSAIAEEIGVSRNTLMSSTFHKWVIWRDMFEKVKRSHVWDSHH